MAQKYITLSEEALDRLLGLVRESHSVADGIDDASSATNSTYSSAKINELLAELGNGSEGVSYTAGTGITISEDNKISTKDIKKNYIDNSNFRINQTGATEYSTPNGYTVDRWYIDGGILTPVENGVQFTNPNTETGASTLVRLRQNIHYGFSEFAGKIITLSAKINGVIYSSTTTIPTEKPTTGTAVQYITAGIADFSINLNYSVTADYFVPYFAVAYSRTVLIEWMKLEVNDEFSGYIEPDYMTELIKMNFTTSDKGALNIPELEKETGILVSTATPSYSNGTIDGVSYKYKLSLSSVKADNNDKTPVVGAYIYNNSYKALYPVVAISEDDDLIYLNTYTSLAGTNGSTPSVNDYGNWQTDSDTGIAAVPQRMSLRKPIDAFFNGSDSFWVTQNNELTNSNILGIYYFAGYYLLVSGSGIEFYTGIEDDSTLMTDHVGMVSFSIPAKEVAILYGSQFSANTITIYITGSDGVLYCGTIDEDSIVNGYFEEVSFMPTGNPATAEQITSLCVCNNKLYCQSAQGTIFLLPSMGNYNNGRIVGQNDGGYILSSDGRFIYRTDNMGITTVSLPCSSNNDMLHFVELTGYQEEMEEVCGICDCDDKMIAISMMGIYWAKNDMLQVFELGEDGTIGSSTMDYQDGVFKPCLINPNTWHLMDTSRASMKSTENFILMFTGSEVALYKKNPFTLFGTGDFSISYGERISSIFETNNKLYIFKKDSNNYTVVYEISLVSPLQPLYKM